MGIFFAETGGLQNMGNARSNVYKGSFQTGPSEDRNGQKKWAAIKPAIAAFDPAPDRARRQGAGARGQARPAVQPLDQRAKRADERARGDFPANPADRESAAQSDRSDEGFRADPDRPHPDQVGAPLGRSGQLPNFHAAHHGIPAQQQHVRVWQSRPGEDLGDVPRDSRRHVAVQSQIRAGHSPSSTKSKARRRARSCGCRDAT